MTEIIDNDKRQIADKYYQTAMRSSNAIGKWDKETLKLYNVDGMRILELNNS